MQFLIILAILALVVYALSEPLRSHSAGEAEDAAASQPARQIADLEAAREAKYREIRETELDHQTGKLSDADFEAVDGALRAEALEILHELDAARAQTPATIGER